MASNILDRDPNREIQDQRRSVLQSVCKIEQTEELEKMRKNYDYLFSAAFPSSDQ